MLRFEFVQLCETLDPYYVIYDEQDDRIGEISYIADIREWQCGLYEYFGLQRLIETSMKVRELNQSTKQQRILGFL